MAVCDEVFKQLEVYEEMTIDYLRLTKIAKVLRHIGCKGEIPRQEEFRFQERAKALVEQWSRLLTTESGDYAKRSDIKESGGTDFNSPVLRDMIMARRRRNGDAAGLKVIV